jgi:3',5'-cyclic AMP phosphodiesterase CpdA
MEKVSRRRVLKAAGTGVVAWGAGGGWLWEQPAVAGTPGVEGVHLTFGEDPAAEMTVSWMSEGAVSRPRVRVGTVGGGYGCVVGAEGESYRDSVSGRVVWVHHARLAGLRPGERYVYRVEQGDAAPVEGMFRTAPRGRAAFTFTSFGDQSTAVQGDTLWSPHAGDIVDQVEAVDPLLHLMNGDLCYANINPDRVKVWGDWFATNARSLRNRPWMPAAGNHENEAGNGPIGYGAYQAYFRLPGGATRDHELRGLWYAYTVGAVRFVHLANDDVAYQDGGGTYVRGYSGGAQRAWLERELAATSRRHDIDWIVVCMHQTIISSADFNGADQGVREEFAPLFDRYGVDLVLCGHEHHYERSHPVRGVVSGSATLTPNPVATDTQVIDTSKGTVHMILGGGGTSAPSNQTLFTPIKAKIITGVGPANPTTGKRPSVFAYEEAPWSAVRDHDHAYGFAGFEVEPGHPGGHTRINVTYYDSLGSGRDKLVPYERFTLQKRRSHGIPGGGL